MAGRVSAPLMGEDDKEWAKFQFQWTQYLVVHDFGVFQGNAAAREAAKQAKAFALLALSTKENARAQEILMDFQVTAVANGTPLSGASAFAALSTAFQPKIKQAKTAARNALMFAIRDCWARNSDEFGTTLVAVQSALRDCVHLTCKPDDDQLVSDFLNAMPDDGAWGVKKSMWLDDSANIANLQDLLEKVRVANLSLGTSPETPGGTCAYLGKQRGKWVMTGPTHKGKPNGKKRKFEDRSCWVCGKQGHISRDCPNRKKGKRDGDDGGSNEKDDSENDGNGYFAGANGAGENRLIVVGG